MGLQRPKPGMAEIGATCPVKVEDPASGAAWQGEERSWQFPKPGGGSRRAYLVKAMALPGEIDKLLRTAKSLDFQQGSDPTDRQPSYASWVMRAGQYQQNDVAKFLRPIVDTRLLPYARHKFDCPGAVVSAAVVRRFKAEERTSLRTHVDGHYFCSAVFELSVGSSQGGWYLQGTPHIDSQNFVQMDKGDALWYQYDLLHGVQIESGEQYFLVCYFKDSILSCLTNSVPWYNLAAEESDVDAQAILGWHLEEGSAGVNGAGEGSNFSLAAHWYRKAAEQGHANAQYRLGIFYEHGFGDLPQDPKEAMTWWRKAAEQGYACAQRCLGQLLFSRDDFDEAMRWLQAAAKQGDADAAFALAAVYASGRGVPRDEVLAAKWSHDAARLGHADSQYEMGASLLKTASSENLRQACKWFQLAAIGGNTKAQCNLGSFYAEGLGGLEKDLKLALHWYQEAASSGDVNAQYNLSLMHGRGLGGLQKDEEASIELCRKAAAQGHPKARAILGTKGNDELKMTAEQHKQVLSLEAKLQRLGARSSASPINHRVEQLLDLLSNLKESSTVGNERTSSTTVSPSSGQEQAKKQITAQSNKDSLSAASSKATQPAKSSTSNSQAKPSKATPSMMNRPKVHDVIRVSLDCIQDLEDFEKPVIVTNAAEHLGGQNILEFMPKLMASAGASSVSYEVQGPKETVTMQAPLALYMQEMEKSEPGRGYLMMSQDILSDPELSKLIDAPACCEPDLLGQFPLEMQPKQRLSLVMGGRGAQCQLHRDPLTWNGWHVLVLGQKKWRLYPPRTPLASLCADLGPWGSGTSPVNAFDKNPAIEFPEWSPTQVWEATQEMGEVLLIPAGWWHQTQHTDRTMGILGQYVTVGAISYVLSELSQWLGKSKPFGEPLEALKFAQKKGYQHDGERPDRSMTLTSGK